jgi:hypothetical protein
LCSIFNASVREGFVPSIWKAANITPIWKAANITTIQFVDDTSLWEIISNNSPSQLPANIISCSEWSSVNNMKLNVSKTKELRVCFSKLIPSFAPITICGQEVDVVSEAKLLGVVLSDDLKWNRHIDYICKKAAKRLYGLRLLKRNALPSHI